MRHAVPFLMMAALAAAAPAMADPRPHGGDGRGWRGDGGAWQRGGDSQGRGRGDGDRGGWRGRGDDGRDDGGRYPRLGGPLYAGPGDGGPGAPSGPGDRWRPQQDEARDRVRRGELRSLPYVLNDIRRREPGRQLDTGIGAWGDGRPTYRVRWAAQNGRVIDYVVDARTGAILSVEGR